MIDFTRKFTVSMIEATGKNNAPRTNNYALTSTDLARIQRNLQRHIRHLGCREISIYFRKTGYSSNYYDLHVCINGVSRTIEGVERKVAASIARTIEINEFLGTKFNSHTEFLAFIGIGIQYLD
ncbi:hypothetical protein [Burkholderia sp. LMG 13014]|uniref:hypothetical protein n=1 Tax=Burkholderia sp. LMG 13014 TaxID=2709306 RepID=UPI0019638FB5|nr:hypothetical protein [Burkholderia sp. LMG 13014]